MKDSVILEGKIYISAKRAAKIINYAQDYIGQLCRSGKLDCKMIGRSWFVTEESLLAHRADAIDNTQERVLKVIKNNDVATKETIKAVIEKKVEVVAPKVEAPVSPVAVPSPIAAEVKAPVVSPIQSTGFKYETENKSFLPELKKKVPAAFELPKTFDIAPTVNVIKIKKISTPRVEVRASAPSAAAIALPRSPLQQISTTALVTLIALGGFIFTLSVASLHNTKTVASSRNEASIGSATANLISEIMQSLGLKARTPSGIALDRDKIKNGTVAEPATAPNDLNGIGIFPALSPTADELQKQKIMNTFSDEVVVEQDPSGTSGVITPVFKKTNGTDFVYVMVPVKEKKQE